MKVDRLDRICIAVPDLEEGMALFRKSLGLEFEYVGDIEGKNKLALSNQGLELLEVPGREMHLRSFHFKVKDLKEAKDWVEGQGVRVVSEFSVGQMDEMVLDLGGLRTILINYPGSDAAAAAKGKAGE